MTMSKNGQSIKAYTIKCDTANCNTKTKAMAVSFNEAVRVLKDNGWAGSDLTKGATCPTCNGVQS